MLRKVLFCSSAVALVALWAAGETPGVAQEAELCNPVVDSAGNPVAETEGGVVTHSGTFECPVETAEVTPTATEVEPAAPPPEPLPEGGVVFFPLDVAELDEEAQQTLRNVIGDIQDRDLQGITVAGHADRSGPDDYNMALSDRRAQNVAAELVKSGIPARVIETEAFGETQPAVPTEDGVVLQANRRATVDFAF